MTLKQALKKINKLPDVKIEEHSIENGYTLILFNSTDTEKADQLWQELELTPVKKAYFGIFEY